MRHRTRLAAAFAGVALVVVLGAAVVGALVHDGPPEPPAIETDQYDAANALPDAAEEGGEIRMDSGASGERVIVDTAHSNGVTDRALEPLVGALSTNGHQVRTYDGVRLLSLGDALSNADALVVVNPEQSFTHEELDAVGAFRDNGGRVLVAMDPESRNAIVESDGNLGETTIFSELGLERGQGYLYNGASNENNYVRVIATPDDDSPLTEGVDRVVLPGASPVGIDRGRVALSTTDGTRLSTTEGTDSHPVLVHDDGVLAVGDVGFMRPGNARHADNDVLIGNLADYLVEGDRIGTELDDSEPDDGNGTAADGTATAG